MPDIVELGSSQSDPPRSQASISTEPNRRHSFKAVHHPEKDTDPPTSISPLPRLTRKRAASLNTESARLPPSLGDLALGSPVGPLTPDVAREQVCLCQPDPKIPRPRNAFILYRQHYQAQVVGQNPGLANPEISKIIGEQWREQAPEIKSDWKRLAEEEKLRHQRKYPGYRYQPRRAGKPSGARPFSASSTDDPIRCPKCSGRYISTPSTPLNPFTPGFGTSTSALTERFLPTFNVSGNSRSAPLERSPSSLQMYSGKMDSPRTAPPYAQGYRRGPHSQPQQLHTHHENDEDVDLLNPTSDPKRRRFSNEPHFQRSYASSTSPMSYTSAQLFARSGIPISATSHRTPYSGGLSLLARPGNMDPPAQRSPVGPKSQHQYPTRGNTFDESLRLPPLKTQLPSQNQLSSQRADLWSNDRDSEARSVEAMVMTIPYVNKIKVLAKISPPLPPPGPKSPAQQTRGVLIAIEGVDGSLLAETGSFLNKYLGKDSSCAIKTWSNYPAPSRSPMGGSPGLDAEMAGTVSKLANLSSIDGSIAQNAFVEYLSIISEWHKKSQEIARYITTAPTLSPIGSNNSSSAFPIVPKTFPVAILPQGFSLTTSDSFAVRIPINDSYAPADHWQWMATLWRGIIGPDLTIYVKRVDREELERYGGVEIRADCAGIIIRVLELGSIDEKTARRLGFEVMEFIRGVENSSILLDPTSKKSGT